MIAAVVKELIAAGVTGDALVMAIERIEAAMGPELSPGAIRTRRWRANKERCDNEASQTVTERHDNEASQASQNVTERHGDADNEASQSVTERHGDVTVTPPPSLSPSPSFPPHPPNNPLPLFLPPLSRAVGKPTRTTDDKEFEEFWRSYPRRKGQADKSRARVAYRKQISAGTTSEVLLAAARAYAVEQRELGKVNTEFIKMPATWLNGRCWEDYSATAPPQETNQMAEEIAIIRRQIAEAGNGKAQNSDTGREWPDSAEELRRAG